jgi:beta-N-acetylhexosaminidase
LQLAAARLSHRLSRRIRVPVHLDRKGERWAATTLRKMTLEEKIGQMIMPWARIEFMNVNRPRLPALREEMRKYHVGGFGVTVFADGASLAQERALEAAAAHQQPAARFQVSAPLRRRLRTRPLHAPQWSHQLSGSHGLRRSGRQGTRPRVRQHHREEARAIGIQWNWFPVADVNSNPANPIINTRSFSEDPAQVSDLGHRLH